MNNWVPAAAVGCVLLVTGGGMLLWQRRTWLRLRGDDTLDPAERTHYRRRYRRRMQTSGLIALLGLLIPLGDTIVWGLGPAISAVYWISVLLMAFWVLLLAVGDIASTRVFSRAALARVRRHQRELEDEIARYHRESNGQHAAD